MKRLWFFGIAAALACGGGATAPTDGGPHAAHITLVSGSGQVVRIGSAVPSPPVFLVTNSANVALSDATVAFSVTAGGGMLESATAVTGADGKVTLPGWTLGSATGANTVSASFTNATPVTVSATARLPRWTVMVYMAADNNLTPEGLDDLDEMDVAGSDPEVRAVVQAEFSPSVFQVAGVPASVANIPASFNTFRYQVGSPHNMRLGPESSVVDIGNQDMTSATTLRNFVQYAKTTLPAEHYLLVLWNHGGGYQGLIADETSRPGHLMSLDDLSSALAGNTVDIVDFDMCLMAGYETLAKLQASASYAVFSEEVVPGAGNAYTGLLQDLETHASDTPRSIAKLVADTTAGAYHYDRSSTTFSAYDLSEFQVFEGALNAVANTMTANLTALSPALSASIATSQKYSVPYLTDIGDFTRALGLATTDTTLKSQLAALKAQVTSLSFRLASHANNGTDAGSPQMLGSTGLNILLPSGQTFDALPGSGEGSIAAYQALMPGRAWTQFLTAWSSHITSQQTVDLGQSRLELYLVWDSASVHLHSDVDLWVLEPDGNLYIPWMGTLTPNGALTGDSYDTQTYYEGYFTNRYVQAGRYKFYANLFSDPTDHRPPIDVLSRFNASISFSSQFAPNYPHLSKVHQWLNDPTPTFAKIEQGQYTDLVYLAYWDAVGSGSAMLSRAGADELMTANLAGEGATAAQESGPMITPAQMRAVRAIVKSRALASSRTSGWSPQAAGSAPVVEPVP